MQRIPGFGPVRQGNQPLIRGHTQPRFQVWVPTWGFRCGPQTTDWGAHPLGHFGSVRPGSQAADQGARPPGVSGVGAQSADLGARNRASGVCWGCLSRVHSPGAERVGGQEATAAAESSLTSH